MASLLPTKYMPYTKSCSCHHFPNVTFHLVLNVEHHPLLTLDTTCSAETLLRPSWRPTMYLAVACIVIHSTYHNDQMCPSTVYPYFTDEYPPGSPLLLAGHIHLNRGVWWKVDYYNGPPPHKKGVCWGVMGLFLETTDSSRGGEWSAKCDDKKVLRTGSKQMPPACTLRRT